MYEPFCIEHLKSDGPFRVCLLAARGTCCNSKHKTFIEAPLTSLHVTLLFSVLRATSISRVRSGFIKVKRIRNSRVNKIYARVVLFGIVLWRKSNPVKRSCKPLLQFFEAESQSLNPQRNYGILIMTKINSFFSITQIILIINFIKCFSIDFYFSN